MAHVPAQMGQRDEHFRASSCEAGRGPASRSAAACAISAGQVGVSSSSDSDRCGRSQYASVTVLSRSHHERPSRKQGHAPAPIGRVSRMMSSICSKSSGVSMSNDNPARRTIGQGGAGGARRLRGDARQNCRDPVADTECDRRGRSPGRWCRFPARSPAIAMPLPRAGAFHQCAEIVFGVRNGRSQLSERTASGAAGAGECRPPLSSA